MRPAVVPRTPLRSIGGLVALGTFAAWLGLSGVFGSATASAGQAGTPAAGDLPAAGDVAAGRSLYLNTCAACHGSQAEGSQLAPGLREAGHRADRLHGADGPDAARRTGRAGAPRGPHAAPVRDPEPARLHGHLDERSAGARQPFHRDLGGRPGRGPRPVHRQLRGVSRRDRGGGRGRWRDRGPPLDRSEAIDVLEAVAGGPDPMPKILVRPRRHAGDRRLRGLPARPGQPGGSTIALVGPVPEGTDRGCVGLWPGRHPRRGSPGAGARPGMPLPATRSRTRGRRLMARPGTRGAARGARCRQRAPGAARRRGAGRAREPPDAPWAARAVGVAFLVTAGSGPPSPLVRVGTAQCRGLYSSAWGRSGRACSLVPPAAAAAAVRRAATPALERPGGRRPGAGPVARTRIYAALHPPLVRLAGLGGLGVAFAAPLFSFGPAPERRALATAWRRGLRLVD